MNNPKWLNTLIDEAADDLIEGKELILFLNKKKTVEGVYRAHFLAGKYFGLIKAAEVAACQSIGKNAQNTLLLMCEEMTVVGIELQLFNMPVVKKHDDGHKKPNLN